MRTSAPVGETSRRLIHVKRTRECDGADGGQVLRTSSMLARRLGRDQFPRRAELAATPALAALRMRTQRVLENRLRALARATR